MHKQYVELHLSDLTSPGSIDYPQEASTKISCITPKTKSKISPQSVEIVAKTLFSGPAGRHAWPDTHLVNITFDNSVANLI